MQNHIKKKKRKKKTRTYDTNKLETKLLYVEDLGKFDFSIGTNLFRVQVNYVNFLE